MTDRSRRLAAALAAAALPVAAAASGLPVATPASAPLAAAAALAPPVAMAASPSPPAGQGTAPGAPAALPIVRLEDLERRALQVNPAMAAAAAALRVLDEQIRGASSDSAVARQLAQVRGQLVAEQQRMAAKFRTLFFHTLHNQRRVESRQRLAQVAREAAGVTDQLVNVGAADHPDRLAIEDEAQVLEAALAAARLELEEMRTVLEAAVGDPAIDLGPLDGDLVAELPKIDREQWRQRLLRESPSLLGIQAEIAQDEETLARARRDPQGTGAATAAAALAQARLRAEQVRITLEASFAENYGGYRSAVEQLAAYYSGGVLARAERAYEETLHQYQQMAAAYPQVLIARRHVFQMQDAALDALQRAWSEAIDIQALLSYELPQNLAPPLAPAQAPAAGDGASGHN